MNITDVGHLTSDADDGEDKILTGAKREKKTPWEIAEYYTDAFKQDIKKLNILKPTIWCRATDHITEQLDMIKKLGENGLTYSVGGNIYFDTSKLDDYGKLFGLDLSKEGKPRVDEDKNKRNSHDFVLWFTKSKFDDQEMKWKGLDGKYGYPGWHIECSAMASKYLGKQFDIHCGGIDHIQVHHTNEIAQSEGALGKKPWVRFWMHNEFLVMDKGKMSKSKGEFIALAKLVEKGFDPLDYRYFCLTALYRKPLVFSWGALESAKVSRHKLFSKVLEVKEVHGADNDKMQGKYLQKFMANVNDDLNTPQALATLWEVLKDENLSNHDKYFLSLEFDKVLGFEFGKLKIDRVPKEVNDLATKREVARKDKDWKKSDKLRDDINKLGWVVEDSVNGFELKKK
jgi:cysteinyl-tRNA synthetase